MNILIIGGNGYFGTEISKVLASDGSYTIWIGSRDKSVGNKLNISWEDPAFPEKIKPFEVVINTAPWKDDDIYFNHIHNAIDLGKIVIETTADPALINKIQQRKEMSNNLSSGKSTGTYIHGAGLFPGLSNLFCQFHLQQSTTVSSIQFAIRYNIFSGAGKGMCHLMAKIIQEPSYWIENGNEKSGPPIGRSVTMYSNMEKIKGSRVLLPDYLYLREKWDASNIETILSIKPMWLNAISPYSILCQIQNG